MSSNLKDCLLVPACKSFNVALTSSHSLLAGVEGAELDGLD